MPVSLPGISAASWDTAPPVKLAGKSLPIAGMQTHSQTRLFTPLKGQAKATTKFYLLPLKKMPLQPNRFAPQAREAFRQALAEKVKTHPRNIQLRIIFERMHMPLYSSIAQDDHGQLLCTPKAEAVGRNQEASRMNPPAAYLVLGTRLDTKEDVRALVPVDAVAGKAP